MQKAAKEKSLFHQQINMKSVCAFFVTLAVLFATPVLADKDSAPGQNKDKKGSEYSDVDCSKIKDDDARKKCREAKLDNKDKDYSGVDCRKLDDEDARRKCREAKYDR